VKNRVNQSRITGLLPSVFISILVIIYMLVAYWTLDGESRQVPLLTAYITLFLLAIDLFSGLKHTDAAGISAEKGVRVIPAQELRVLLSVMGLVTGIYLAGFYIAVFLYLVIALRCLGQQSLRFAVFTAFLANIFIFLIFKAGLSLSLYEGVFFA
jgi:hypothetical protein